MIHLMTVQLLNRSGRFGYTAGMPLKLNLTRSCLLLVG